MHRRDFLTSSLAAATSLAAPAIARGAEARVLRFVPQANLPNLDPVWGTQYVVRNASLLVFDTLFGLDASLTPRPQMCESFETSSDGLTWRFRLRPGLTFHDGTRVLARDATASLGRWMARDTMGQLIRVRLDAMAASDDRTFEIRLKTPFPKLLFALAKGNPNLPAIMPERIAQTDPFKQIGEFIGSGPMTFQKDEWVPGSRAVFARFDGYAARDEPGNWMAGGKRIYFDRVEWQIIPDAATAAAALQSGEVDWWETPLPDLVPLLRQNEDVRVDIADPLGNVGILRMNHLYPPFNDVRLRRALQMVVNQPDYMRAIVGNDDALWKPMPSFITPGTPLYTEAGGEALSGPRDFAGAKKLLAEAGYGGEKVVMLVATDLIITKGQGDVSADVMAKAGFNVDYVATDWGTVGARRAKKDPPSQGGWNMFHTWLAGVDCINPAPNIAIHTTGPKAWFGWPDNPAIEAMIGDWYAAPDLASEKQQIEKINRASMEFVTFIPTGFFYGYQAWRRGVEGIVKAPFPVFWDVKKA
ncbi:MAG: ABC transporter substrate-binding protein [Acidibrevibacterium sp.]|uniref:ABC transporter substrate-binding protein n=1 Tax=Acidibrevibacterium sp. TaxID=2606776 RepID=UPI003D06A3A0